jgi:hypothetical protein
MEDLDYYIVNGKGSKYKDHNLALRQWFKRDKIKKITEKPQVVVMK